MNERFKTLWFEAAESKGGDSWEEQTAFMERFAELIVRECGVALNPPVQNRNVISRGQAYNLIKEHFGVEE